MMTRDPDRSETRRGLEQLNGDVLLQLLASVESKKDLANLSSTCRWLRMLCMPLLFARFLRYVTQPLNSRNKLLPAFLWPYVKDLTLVDVCPDRPVGKRAIQSPHNHGGLMWSRDPFQCGVLDNHKLLQVLRRSHNLTSVSLVMHKYDAVHGVSWNVLQTILTLPSLREFSAIGLLLSPSTPPSDFDPSRIAPLRLLRYEPHISRKDHPFQSEEETLNLLLATCHHTLEVLSLPSEPTHIEDLASREWPCLRELRIRGEQWSTPDVPFTSLFSKMRGLRTLVLQLTVAEGIEPRMFYDPRKVVPFPWPELQQFTSSHPSIKDAVYSNLPEHLHVLSMSCYPHLAERPWLHAVTYGNFGYPVPTSSEMLHIIQQCRTPELVELHLEYRADYQEAELLRYVASTFANIQILQIYRYRSQAENHSMEGNLIRLLAPLSRLSQLMVHLDLEGAPTPSFEVSLRGWGGWLYNTRALDSYVDSLQDVAERCARHLCPSVTSIFLWSPGEEGRPEWWKFTVTRSGGVGDPVVTREDTIYYSDLPGLQTY